MELGARPRIACAWLAALAAALLFAPSAPAHPGDEEKVDLTEAFGTPANPIEVPEAKAQQRAEPPLVATPGIPCGPGSRPETDIQGRVPQEDFDSGRAAEGYTCNTKQLGSYEVPNTIGSIGGFKVERYVDEAGHECAYYDTTLLAPTNIFDGEAGVNVMDMSDPKNPVRTTRLITPAMLSPHESLVVSQERGVLAAVLGNPAFNLGVVDLYDISEDCRAPVFKSTTPFGIFGHEIGDRARRQDLLLRLALHVHDRRPGHHEPVTTPPALVRRLRLARAVDLRLRGPRLRCRNQLGPHRSRHLRDPGPRAESAGDRALAPYLGFDVDPPERDTGLGRRQEVRRRDRRVWGPVGGRRGPHHQHRGRDQAQGRLEPPARRSPARELRGPGRRPRQPAPAPGLCRPLLQRPSAQGPGHRRVLDDPLRPQGLRHPRSQAPQGDRVFQRSDQGSPPPRGFELGHVKPGLRCGER